MLVNSAYKFRLYPNSNQTEMLNKTFGCCRLLYNKMLDERKKIYALLKDDKEKLYSHKYRTEKEYKSEIEFLKEVDSKALQSSTNNLRIAFKNFFEGLKKSKKIGFPRFKSSKSRQSYTTYNIHNNIKINFNQKRIKLPKIKTWIKFSDERVFNEKIKHVTVSKTKSGKYHVSILIEREILVQPMITIDQKDIIGFDMSAQDFLVNYNFKLVNPRFYRKNERKLKRYCRNLSRKKKGSNNRNKARQKLSNMYDRIYNQKLDWVHKTTHKLSKKYDAIILENLNIQGMQKFNSGLSKSVTLDFSWFQFKVILQYKMDWKGKHLVLVEKFFASSKLCAKCGWKNNDLTLKDRTWKCQQCSAINERDENASENIETEGIRILKEKGIKIINTVGTTGIHAFGDYVRPTCRQRSMKEESTTFK